MRVHFARANGRNGSVISRDEDAPGSAPEFEKLAAVLARGLDVETNVRSRRVGYEVIVGNGRCWAFIR